MEPQAPGAQREAGPFRDAGPATDLPPVPERPARKRPGWVAALREVAVVAAIALLLSFVIKTFLLQPFWIPSESMEPALVPGDRVVVSKLTPGPFDLKRGDVVVFTDPGGWLGDDETSKDPGPVKKALEFIGLYPAGDDHLIKRLIGLPGDHVTCCDSSGRLGINGTPINEPYLADDTKPSLTPFNITVPRGRIWVMGDNRGDSGDSRYHDDGTGATGSVPEKDVTGRADAVLWPLNHLTWLGNYPATFAKVHSR